MSSAAYATLAFCGKRCHTVFLISALAKSALSIQAVAHLSAVEFCMWYHLLPCRLQHAAPLAVTLCCTSHSTSCCNLIGANVSQIFRVKAALYLNIGLSCIKAQFWNQVLGKRSVGLSWSLSVLPQSLSVLPQSLSACLSSPCSQCQLTIAHLYLVYAEMCGKVIAMGDIQSKFSCVTDADMAKVPVHSAGVCVSCQGVVTKVSLHSAGACVSVV